MLSFRFSVGCVGGRDVVWVDDCRRIRASPPEMPTLETVVATLLRFASFPLSLEECMPFLVLFLLRLWRRRCGYLVLEPDLPDPNRAPEVGAALADEQPSRCCQLRLVCRIGRGAQIEFRKRYGQSTASLDSKD